MGDTINLSGKTVAVIIIILLLLFGAISGFFFKQSGNNKNISGNSAYGDMPNKCKIPAGEDVDSWKEHLGHHDETTECLQYFK